MKTTTNCNMWLFSVDPSQIVPCVAAGVSTVVVDWEIVGKHTRQRGANTQINSHTTEDLLRVRSCTSAELVCRVNPVGDQTADEIRRALDHGADALLIPQIRSAKELEEVLEVTQGATPVYPMLETRESITCAREIAALSIHGAYVGLNDLAISLGNDCIFDVLIDGTIESLRPLFSVPFGMGGLTLPQYGSPVPSRMLIQEWARLQIDFTVLRRSFLNDSRWNGYEHGVYAIRHAYLQACNRSQSQIYEDFQRLAETVQRSGPQLRSHIAPQVPLAESASIRQGSTQND